MLTSLGCALLATFGILVQAWTLPDRPPRSVPLLATPRPVTDDTITTTDNNSNDDMFESFVDFLVQKQSTIIAQLEDYEQGSATFSRDAWGVFDNDNPSTTTTTLSGGLTRVLQGGHIIEKGACSLTVIRKGTLTADRAATIRDRQAHNGPGIIQEGDEYAAAALSMVLHSRNPHVPTFRSDVRVFSVTTANGQTLAWFGGGADLTPYYLYDADITFFHQCYQNLCQAQDNKDDIFSYPVMKKACDDYFYLPARSEHRGTGGIFFDDMIMDQKSLAFCQGVADTWMPSWLPIVEKRQATPVTEQERQWQLLRRGRYLEFNLLYDRGVKFGLANANPRVEGVMVSAPPLIAWEYNHKVKEGSEEDRLVKILQQPKEWV